MWAMEMIRERLFPSFVIEACENWQSDALFDTVRRGTKTSFAKQGSRGGGGTFPVELRGVSVVLDGHRILSDLDFELDGREILLGPNGSGKSTLIRAILGLVPSSGSIRIGLEDARRIKRLTGLSTNINEAYSILSLSVNDLIKVYAEIKGGDKDEAFERIQRFDLKEVVLKKRLYQLSTGERKMVTNILALSFTPSVLLLDEPFENIDPARRMLLVDEILASGKTILLVTHELDLLKYFKDWKLSFMIRGRVFGKLNASDITDCYFSEGRSDSSILLLDIDGKQYSITRGSGKRKLSDLYDINRIYEEVSRGEL